MKYGYARVSTEDQSIDMQVNALNKYGCDKIIREKLGAMKDRPKLEALLNAASKGDEIVIFKLDRLGRSLKHLLSIIEDLQNKGIELISLNDNINTTTSQGKLMFQIIGAFAEFERNLISERTKAGLEAVRAKGTKLGRPYGLSLKAMNNAELVQKWHKSKPVNEVCKRLGISRRSYYKYLSVDLSKHV